jgi:hypothetical protein
MGLCPCVFENDEQLDGVDVGSYADFGHFRDAVARLAAGPTASKYPTLLLHSDCDGEWTVDQSADLEKEPQAIAIAFHALPVQDYNSPWQIEVAKFLELRPRSLYDSFIDVDGEPLIERLLTHCRLSQEHRQPILFQ